MKQKRALFTKIALPLFLALSFCLIFKIEDVNAQTLISNISVGNTPRGVAVNPVTNRIYSGSSDNNITVVDGNSNLVVNTIFVPNGTTYLDINPVTNRLYTAKEGSNIITVVDTNTDSIITTIPTGSGNKGIAVNSNTNLIYVSSSHSGAIKIIDGNTNNMISSLYLPGITNFLDINESTNKIYVANENYQESLLSVIDGTTNTVSSTIVFNPFIGGTPYWVAVNPNTNKIYVTHFWSKNLSVIDGDSNMVVDTISLGTSPSGSSATGVAVNPVTNRIYTSLVMSNSVPTDLVLVVDGYSNQVIKSVPVDKGVWGNAINPSMSRIYSAHAATNVISVIEDLPSDTTPPLITPQITGTLGNNGWYTSDVTISWVVEDPESGITETFGCEALTITEDTAGATFQCTVTNSAGLSNSETVFVKVDKTAPLVIINAPSDGNIFTLNEAIFADWSVSDSLSGIAGVNATVPNGSLIDTSAVGTRIFNVTATDLAGNITSLSNTYNVQYNFGGFLPPIGTGRSVFKIGGTIPVKFQLFDASGTTISTAEAQIFVAKISDGVIGTDEEPTSASAADSGNTFRYDELNGQYIYNLSTKNPPLGQIGTYQIKIVLNDGTNYITNISLR